MNSAGSLVIQKINTKPDHSISLFEFLCKHSQRVEAQEDNFPGPLPSGAWHHWASDMQQFTAMMPTSGLVVFVTRLNENSVQPEWSYRWTLSLYTQKVAALASTGLIVKIQMSLKHPLMMWWVPKEVSQAQAPSLHMPVYLRRKCWPCPFRGWPWCGRGAWLLPLRASDVLAERRSQDSTERCRRGSSPPHGQRPCPCY